MKMSGILGKKKERERGRAGGRRREKKKGKKEKWRGKINEKCLVK